jgi:general secretion pathway protein N
VAALSIAPAAWLDPVLERATRGQLRLAEASGTVWSGQGRLVFAGAHVTAPNATMSVEARPVVMRGVALPGRVRWQITPWPLLVGMIDAQLMIDGMKQAARIEGRFLEARMSNNQVSLARTDLGALGSPWSTVRPAGAVRVSWEGVTIQAGRFEGRVIVELHDLSSALSAVRPLGSYRIQIDARADRTTLEMKTMSGALELSGRGEVDRGRLRFTAQAAPADPQDSRLTGLLGLLGPREGAHTVIRIGG